MYVLEATARVANRIYEREGVEVGVRIQKSRREVFDQSPMKTKLVRSQGEKRNWTGEIARGIADGIRKAKLDW